MCDRLGLVNDRCVVRSGSLSGRCVFSRRMGVMCNMSFSHNMTGTAGNAAGQEQTFIQSIDARMKPVFTVSLHPNLFS